MNGPFFEDRDTSCSPYALRAGERTMFCPLVLLRRVRWPIAGWPHGLLGGMPVGDLPSPPPCGWSRGFMATPRTSGRLAHVIVAGLAEL